MGKPSSAAASVRSGTTWDQDFINRSTWERPDTVDSYRRLRGWTDPGEQAAIERVAPEVRGQPVLDMGVGAGRTTALLLPLSTDYLGIDYTPAMVEACRATFAGTRFEHMDARDLGALRAGHFALGVFSFNGIDSVPHGDRLRVLRQVHRVLRPGGLFVMSAHNRDGPGARERPRLDVRFTPNPLKLGWRLLRGVAALPRAIRNHRRLRAGNEVHDDWSLLNCGAHGFGLMVVYTSLAAQLRQLEDAGFGVEAVFDNLSGAPVDAGADTRQAWWFHYVARKAVAH